MGIKNAGKAKIKKNLGKAPTKETVDTPISECEAENPLNCRFHGLQALKQQLSALFPAMGYKVPFGTEKLQGGKGFEIRIDGKFDVDQGEFKQSLTNAFKQQGWDLTYNGKVEGAGHSFFLKKGNGEIEKPSVKDNSDIVDSSKPPKDDEALGGDYGVEDFNALLEEAKLEEPTLKKDPFEGLDDTGLTDEDVKDFLGKNGITEKTHHSDEPFSQTIADWKSLIENGKTTYGAAIEDFEVDKLKEFYDAAGPDNKAAQYLWGQMAQHGMIEEEPAKSEDFDLMEFIGNPEKLKGSDMSNFDVLLEEGMGNFDALLAEEEGEADATPTWEEIKEFLQKSHIEDNPSQEFFEPMVLTGKLNNGENIGGWVHILKPALDDFPSDNKVVKAIKKWMDAASDEPKAAGKDAENKSGLNGSDKQTATQSLFDISEAWDETMQDVSSTSTGKGVLDFTAVMWKQKNEETIDKLNKDYKEAESANDVQKMDEALKELQKLLSTKPKKSGKESEASTKKSAEESPESNEEADDVASPIMGVMDASLMKPLEHDESKFPQNLTKAMIDKALSSSSAKALGGASGDNATLVTIDGKRYVVKSGSHSHADHIHNEVLADLAYRAGGVRVPDCKEYVIAGKTYKLAEYIEGQSLSSYMASASKGQIEKVRKDLLQGFPLDVLFSNWDVIGTSRDNVIVDNEGHAWRIDNGGSFKMAAQSNQKTLAWAIEKYIKKPQAHGKPPLAIFENWDTYKNGWADRQWIDDFRTMRIDEKNKGVFDKYSTADIFLAATHIDFGHAVAHLPEELRNALAKPIYEMESMAVQAKLSQKAGYPTFSEMKWVDLNGNTQITKVDMVSSALDAIYEAHKSNCREWLNQETSWGSLGWLAGNANGVTYQKKVFPKPAPPKPNLPVVGMDLTAPILTAIISINHHVKTGDHTPNKTSLKNAIALKPILEVFANNGMAKAKELLKAVQKIEDAQGDGYKTSLTFDTADQMFDAKGLKLVCTKEMQDVYAKHIASDLEVYEKKKAAYEAEKEAFDAEESRKAKAAGAPPANTFQDYEDSLIKANIDTNGVPHGNGDPECITLAKSSQQGCSYNENACRKKIRQFAMMGIPLDKMYFSDDNPVFYNGHIKNGGHHVSGYGKTEKDFFAEIDFYRANPEVFKKDMEAYARHKGMMALVHTNMKNPAVNAKEGTVFVMREEHVEAWGKGGINKPKGKSHIIPSYPIDSSPSAQINGVGTLGNIHVGWQLPIWRVTDNFMIGNLSKGEIEICINPIKIPYPTMYFSDSDAHNKGWKYCMEKYNQALQEQEMQKN